MHGTFRSQIEYRAGAAVRFGGPGLDPTPKPTHWRANLAALLAGGCVAALPVALQPGSNAERQAPARSKAPAARTVELVTPHAAPKLSLKATYPRAPAAPVPSPPPPVSVADAEIAPAPAPPATPRVASAPLPAPLATAADVGVAPGPPPATPGVAISPSPATPVADAGADAAPEPSPPAIPRFAIAPLAAPPVVVNLPTPPARLAVADTTGLPSLASPSPAEPTEPPPAQALRQVDVPQIADREVRSLRVPQLREPGLAAGGAPTLAAKVAAMQVTPLPPVRLREADRAALLAEAPTRMMLRIGGSALGKVDFRMTDARTIDVKLSGLLDLLAGHYDAAEFARLRNSAAADAYVSFDQLRALGLNVRYDPVYDELRING